MTCIVGIRDERAGVAVVAGDSAGVGGYDLDIRRDPKVFRIGDEVALGFTSSYRMGQILRFHVDLTPIPRRDQDPYAWAVTRFVPAARAALKEHGYVKVESGVEQGGTFVLAVGGSLFTVQSDFQVAEVADEYVAVGCGGSIATGALWATRGWSGDLEGRARRVLDAASHHSAGVQGPYVVERVGG